MKKLLSFLSILVLSGSPLLAANIAWVSFHAADDMPSANSAAAGFTNAPDIGYTTLLTANGHQVTRFVSVDLDAGAYPDLIAAFNTNDLVIVSRSVPSGHYELLNETAAWNTSVTVPLMSLNGYIDRANRLGFHTGNTIPDINSNPVRLRVSAPAHPIFNGITLNSTNLMINPFAEIAVFTNTASGVVNTQRGISVVTSAVLPAGTVLATVGTPGDAALSGMVIGEFLKGVTSQRGDILAEKRLVFLTGSRELNITSEGAGIYDLLPDGAIMFTNAVHYLTADTQPVASQPLVGATNLLAGDSWTFNAGVFGGRVLYPQWYKDGQPLSAGTNVILTLNNLDPIADAGEYQLIVTNSVGSATSTVARLEFAVFPPANITNSIISYWPLDAVLGNKTVDLVSGYDMTLNFMSAADLVSGKWSSGFQFNGTNSLLSRIDAAGEALPIYQHPNFSVSLWVNAPAPTAAIRDRRAFSEGSTVDTDPLFNIGTDNRNPPDGSVDIYVRNDAGTVLTGDHQHSTGMAYDGANWHNIVYVQRDVGNGNMKVQLWVDGVLDSIVVNPPPRPLTPNTTTIGGILRSSASAWFLGTIDEVAVWNRALSSEEIGILQVTQITNPPSRLQPLAINSFKADLPAVVSGDSTVLRWDVSKDATQVTISPLGDVTSQTVVGIGSRSITQSVATTYVLTVNRGVDTLSATTSVAVVEGVAAGWKILDNFDQAQLGNLFASGYWNDTSGNAGQVVDVNGNKALRPTATGISFLNLHGLSIQETQACTLFFRMIAGPTNAAGVTNIVGLTDKSQRSYGDEFLNIGPVVYPTPLTNSAVGSETNAWYLGARNGYVGGNVSNPIDYVGNQLNPQEALEPDTVYNVWIDITNAPLGEFASDIFSVYVQKEGGAPRTLIFQDYVSDRDPFFVDPVLGGMLPVLDKLVVMANNTAFSATFDDFYLSPTAYNATVPKPYGVVVQPPGAPSISLVGGQVQITWSGGVLVSSPNVTGPYVDVPGNPTSPYVVAPTNAATFYRTRN
jgi:hypothetical protein